MPDARVDAFWTPGSFTKNFSWGAPSQGLLELYRHIRTGFAMQLAPVPRSLYKERTRHLDRPWYVPANFFLYNKNVGGRDLILVDELVFQAITQDHDVSFDRLGLFALNLSIAGRWSGAAVAQRWPSLWAHYFIVDRVARQLKWRDIDLSADAIESFVSSNGRYRAEGTRKLSTNLSYIYRVGGLLAFGTQKVEKWWVNCLFLTLDRILSETSAPLPEEDWGDALSDYNFRELSGRWGLEKEAALTHLLVLYAACGASDRFSSERVREEITLKLPELLWLLDEDPRPSTAFHPTNARVWKNIPTFCAQLAKRAGFEIVSPDELATFDTQKFIRERTKSALKTLAEYQIRPIRSAEEITALTREK